MLVLVFLRRHKCEVRNRVNLLIYLSMGLRYHFCLRHYLPHMRALVPFFTLLSAQWIPTSQTSVIWRISTTNFLFPTSLYVITGNEVRDDDNLLNLPKSLRFLRPSLDALSSYQTFLVQYPRPFGISDYIARLPVFLSCHYLSYLCPSSFSAHIPHHTPCAQPTTYFPQTCSQVYCP